MPLKQASVFKAYSGLQCCIGSHSLHTSTSPSVLPIPRARPENKKCKITTRSYATVRNKTFDFRDNLNWPCQKIKSAAPTPTPYDIFEIEQGGVYSKQKFYELVKMYHPDRHPHHPGDHPIVSLTRTECLERYRLVVQAHEILSDPARRKAYDITGAGWGEKATKIHTASPKHTRHSEDSPFGNATWEDWERWYSRTSDKPGPQAYEGTYFNPNAFASIVILLAVISGVLQATHAGQFTGSIEERAAAFTAQTAQFMTDRKATNTSYATAGHATRIANGPAEDRIRHFLERRDPSRYGLNNEEEKIYRKHFTAPTLPPPKSESQGERSQN